MEIIPVKKYLEMFSKEAVLKEKALFFLQNAASMFRIPPEGIAIILGVDRILDMSRTTVNVLGDLVAASWVGKSEGVWSPAMVPAVAGLSRRHALDETPGETLVTDADIRPPRV